MKRTGRKVASFAFILIAGTLLGLWYWHWQSITPRVRADFEWFNTLGFPDVKGCPYVRVATGGGSLDGSEPLQNYYFDGFLLVTNGNTFKVLTRYLTVRTYTNSVGPVPEHLRVGYEVMDLDEQVKLRIKLLEQPPSRRTLEMYTGGGLSGRAQIFALAWACWRQGQGVNARRLYEEAKLWPRFKVGKRGKESIGEKMDEIWRTVVERFRKPQSKADFRANLEMDLGQAITWSAISKFRDTAVSRSQCLEQLEIILKNYPRSSHTEGVRQIAEVLKRMIVEDQQHRKVGTNEFALLGTDEKVRELIFQLRDQFGGQWLFDGVDTNINSQESTNTPMHQLAAMGYPAVPQLIAVLESQTLTRSMRDSEFYDVKHSILTVGDRAVEILEAITGKNFSLVVSNATSRTNEMFQVRRAAEAWWAEFQKKGEKQMLVEGVSTGSYESPAQARLLYERYPEIANATIVLAIEAAGDSWVSSNLVEIVSELGDEASLHYLKTKMLKGPERQSRVAAALGLHKRGDRTMVDEMIQEWKNLPEEIEEGDDGVNELTEFLVNCDSAEAISTLNSKFAQRPLALRMSILRSLDEAEGASPATLAAIEPFFAAALEDTEEQVGSEGYDNGKHYSDPRVCDFAGHFLTKRWPGRYGFDLGATFSTRERQRIECLNVWRRAHGLEVMPLPKKNLTKVGRNESTKVTAIEWMDGSAKPEPAFAARVEKFRNRRLAGEELADLLAGFTRKPEPGASGLEIKCFKDEDLTGVQMMLKLVAGTAPTENQGWDITERVFLGEEALLRISESGGLEGYAKLEDWKNLVEAVKEATEGEPETPFEIRVWLKAGE